MESIHDLQVTTSRAIDAFGQLSPMQVLAGVMIAGALIYLLNRSKDAVLLAATAALYAIPFVMAWVKHAI